MQAYLPNNTFLVYTMVFIQQVFCRRAQNSLNIYMNEEIWKILMFLQLIIFQVTGTRLYHSMFCGDGEEAVEKLWTKGHPSQRNVISTQQSHQDMIIHFIYTFQISKYFFVRWLD